MYRNASTSSSQNLVWTKNVHMVWGTVGVNLLFNFPGSLKRIHFGDNELISYKHSKVFSPNLEMQYQFFSNIILEDLVKGICTVCDAWFVQQLRCYIHIESYNVFSAEGICSLISSP